MRSKFKVTKWVWLLIDSHPFYSKLISPLIPGMQLFENLTLKIKGQGHEPMVILHNYRFRQYHRTSNGVNPSRGFRDMCSTMSGPQRYLIWQVFGPQASPYGANGQITMTMHNYRSGQFHKTSNHMRYWITPPGYNGLRTNYMYL